jgi:cytochrome c553
MRRRSTLLLTLALLMPAAQAAGTDHLDTLEQRVRPCVICHGAEGRASNAGYLPRIAGKPSGYLHRQLLHFRDGRRAHAQMRYLLERQTDAYLAEMADYFGALDLPYPAPLPPQADAAALARGATLVHEGAPTQGIPACAACHGERLTGVAPDIPGLLGLPFDYLASQFGHWRSGQRQSDAPDCMATIATRMALADIEAAAAWLAAQPVPEDAHPADSLPAPLPLECGQVRLEPRS